MIGVLFSLAAQLTIYLDNAATSFPKPPGVIPAIVESLSQCGGAGGRGSHSFSRNAQRCVDQARQLLARLFDVEDPNRLVFTSSGTDALHLVLSGWLHPGDHVVSTLLEHNSVRRPLLAAARLLGAEITWLAPEHNGQISPADVQRSLRPSTRLVCVTHASNVTGVIQPIAEVVDVAHAQGIAVLVDAAQTAGHWPISLKHVPIDFLTCSGHKGLLGPLGTGVLYVAPGHETALRAVRTGGTGSDSESPEAPAHMPDRYEAGNFNVPGLAGLAAAADWHLRSSDMTARIQHEQQLAQELSAQLAAISGVQVVSAAVQTPRVPIVTWTCRNLFPTDVAAILDGQFGIAVRAGLHCAPEVHRCLGTLVQGGAVRASLGAFSTKEDVSALVAALQAMMATV